MQNRYLLECCVDSVESALAAAEGGADRLELCAALIIGGISPSTALFKEVRKSCDLPIRVLLRPRFGDFLYSDYEFEIIKREVEIYREAGTDGIVIGCLTQDGNLNIEQMAELIKTAEKMKITLHRAFDVCADPLLAYRQATELGIDTILTSGQEKDCLTGMPLLNKLCALQNQTGGPHIMAGSGDVSYTHLTLPTT
ncbi:MAG: copper homeostasis protein CutC [Lachnospiraceae bacterium]|nr:copper homeostasis protein CutC [Lachnospiraceae bacterium]